MEQSHITLFKRLRIATFILFPVLFSCTEKGVLFSIPGAEVKVNSEWIAFDNKNKEVILGQNPMDLEWRLNG